MSGRVKTVTRESLAKVIAKKAGVQYYNALSATHNVVNIIQDAIKDGKKVKVSKFGSFVTKLTKQKIGRNPRTRVEVIIPERKVIKFKTSPTLKKRLNEKLS